MATYAVSDLHGHMDVFVKGLERIGFTDADTLYVIGDAIDRGPDGIRILEYIKDHKNMDLLIGNHEFMMLRSVDPDGKDKCNGEDSDLWLYGNGGTKTFAQYAALTKKKRQSLLLWLRRRYVIMTLEVGGRTYCLTHSYYDPDGENKMYFELDDDTVWSIVWRSMYREDRSTRGINIYKDYPYTFLTGHVPVHRVQRIFEGYSIYNDLRIFEKDNFIDIDGGCAAGYHREINNGALFYRLDDRKTFAVPMPEE